jgi:dethiobiotin synthetase
MRSIFITGTDTGIGKTHASAALLHALRRRGLRAVGMKPVASGCEDTPEGWRNDDALALLDASDPMPSYEQVNPLAFADPTTPELAAAMEQRAITLEPLLRAFAQQRESADVVVVEGAGGWLSPWSASLDQSALVKALDLRVVMVAGLKLGGISHARLTARAIVEDGCEFAGWIGNAIDPHQRHPRENFAILARGLPAPCLGVLPFAAEGATSDPDALSVDALLRDR